MTGFRPAFRLGWGFPGDPDGKDSACNAGDLGSIPGLGRSPGEGNGYPLQYSCLENSMDRGAWRVTALGVAKSRTRLSDFTFAFTSAGNPQRMVTLVFKTWPWLYGNTPFKKCCRW